MMKVASNVTTQEAPSSVQTSIPIKVCMHVLGVARTDMRVMRSATALTEAGFDVAIVDVEDSERPAQEYVRNVRLKHIMMPVSFFSTRFRVAPLLRSLQLFVRGVGCLVRTPADVYHAHDITALPACYIAARLHNKPLIFDAHELPLSELEGAKRRWLRRLLAFPLARMIAGSTQIITSSPAYAREMERCYHAHAITVLRNFPVYRTVEKNDRLRQQLKLASYVRIALYQGNIQPDRGLDKLIYAAKYLEQDTVIVLMGKGVEETLAQLHSLINAEGVADKIKIIPAVPYEELLDWTASADIGLNVLPPDYSLSIRFCLPNKLFEYLMAGLPVLTSQLDAVAEVIRVHGVGEVLSSLEPAAIAAAINMLLQDHSVLERMRLKALAVAQELCWEKESSRLVSCYQHLLMQKI